MARRQYVKPEYTYRAHVRKWLTSDTVQLDVNLGFNMHARGVFRLWGVECPAPRGKRHDPAMDRAVSLCPQGTEVTIQVVLLPDGDRRWSAIVHFWGTDGKQYNVNEELIRLGLAKGSECTPIEPSSHDGLTEILSAWPSMSVSARPSTSIFGFTD